MAEHQLQRERGGSAEMGWIKPTCRCGWQGEKVFAWQDLQTAIVKDRESEHMREATRGVALPQGGSDGR